MLKVIENKPLHGVLEGLYGASVIHGLVCDILKFHAAAKPHRQPRTQCDAWRALRVYMRS